MLLRILALFLLFLSSLSNAAPMTFPLSHAAEEDYRYGDVAFGAWRDGGYRKHAGCDLIAPVGTKVYAVTDGVIVDFYYFYSSTYAIEVDHGSFVVRYGEVSRMAAGLEVGSKVRQGQLIGYVGRLESGNSMLHFEMYEGWGSGNLTQNNPPFYRRKDLLDPTDFLISLPYPFYEAPYQKSDHVGDEND